MSKPLPPSAAPAAGHPLSTDNEDGMNIAKIVIVGVVSLVIFAVSAVAAGLILRGDEAELNAKGLAPLPADIRHKEEVGIIDYVPFDSDHRLAEWRAKQEATLTSYGWVDRSKGVIHIPIDTAIKDIIDQAGSAGGGTRK
jgi:hypothetical protein